jgi:hypothetical protein
MLAFVQDHAVEFGFSWRICISCLWVLKTHQGSQQVMMGSQTTLKHFEGF